MKALFFDSETSGLPDFSAPSESPNQPHIVQLGAKLVDLGEDLLGFDVLDHIDEIVKPDGWEIPADVAAIHGITTEHAMDVGIPEQAVLCKLLNLWKQCDVRIAYNEPFDARITRIAIKRLLKDDALADAWKAGKAECVQRMATPIMNLPPTPKMIAARRFHAKSPNLREACEYFTGQPMENAHSAMGDVNAMIAVYLCIKGRKQPTATAAPVQRPLGHRAAYEAALKEEPPA